MQPAAESSKLTPRPAWRDLSTLRSGFAAGLLNGSFGIGGGIVIVPGLMLSRKVGVRATAATSLGAVTVLSLPALAVQVSFSGFVLNPWGYPVFGAISGLAPGLLG
ncbi:MAG: sulfite exporter TauE/SafE family protein, partial [bacterium]